MERNDRVSARTTYPARNCESLGCEFVYSAVQFLFGLKRHGCFTMQNFTRDLRTDLQKTVRTPTDSGILEQSTQILRTNDANVSRMCRLEKCHGFTWVALQFTFIPLRTVVSFQTRCTVTRCVPLVALPCAPACVIQLCTCVRQVGASA